MKEKHQNMYKMACINGKTKYICGVLIILLVNVAVVCEAGAVSGFIQARDAHFALNGCPFLFNGFNSYWMMAVASEPSQRYKISSVLREASAAGLTVCRTWAFSDGGYQALQISPGVYDERVFQVILLVSLLLSSSSFFFYSKRIGRATGVASYLSV
jgi:hypothetical protein